MSHINTLEVYERYMASGLDDAQAREYTNILENSFMTKVNELKREFANNKVISIFGALILLVGASSIGMLWKLTIDMEIMKEWQIKIENKLDREMRK